MKTIKMLLALALTVMALNSAAKNKQEANLFPDGTIIPAWFSDTTKVDVDQLGKKYDVTKYGVENYSDQVQTKQIQEVIDLAAKEGGGVIVFPRGTYISGSLFFKQGTHLYMEDGAELRGSDRIRNFKVVKTRLEGQTLTYFAALINADGLDGFTIAGKGTINGNGFNYWEEFWIRRQYNKQCTNLEALRPRLVYLSNCKNVTVQDVHLINSPFWTNHLYRCDHVRYLGAYIYAPTSGVLAPEYKKGAPSSDAIDLDVCHDILINSCFMSVNDDAVVLKGGKGTWADKDKDNGPCSNIIIQNCSYGVVHGCLTLGSESLHDRNIILRNIHMKDANRVIWLKMRPDTPQHYEYVTVENITGNCKSFLVVRPWTQFFKPEQRDDMPLSKCNNITIRNIKADCENFFDVGLSDKYQLSDFTFENIDVTDKQHAFDEKLIMNTKVKNVKIR